MAGSVSTSFEIIGINPYISAFNDANKAVDSFAAKTKTLDQITSEIRASLLKAETSVTKLKTTTESFAPKPTISRYYENEAAEVKKAVASINNDVASVSNANPRNNPGASSLNRIAAGIDFGDSPPVVPKKSSQLNYGQFSANLYGDSGFNTPAAFRKIGDEAEKAGEKVAKLRGKTTELQRTILELTDDFAPRGFNRPYNAIGREIFGKYNALSGAGETAVDSTARIAAIARVREVSSAVTKAESVALLAATAAEGGNAVAKTAATAASVSLTAAKRAETAATVALTAAEDESAVSFVAIKAAVVAVSAPLTLLAVGAAAVYHITSDIRTEAERRLKLEEKIAFTYGDQLTKQKQSLELFKEQEYLAQRGRDLTKFESGASLDELIKRRDNAQARLGFFPTATEGLSKNQQDELNPRISAIKSEISSLNAQIDASRSKNAKSVSDSFNQNAENQIKSREQAAKYENDKIEKQNAFAKKQADDIKKANDLIESFGKKASETFQSLSLAASSSNPFVSVFLDADTAAKKLEETIKGLPVKLQDAARNFQITIDSNKAFGARLDNDFSAFDLRRKASELRDFKPKTIEDTAKFFSDFLAAGIKQAVAANGGSNIRYNRLATGGFSQSNIADELTNSFDVVSKQDGSFGGFSRRTRTFADLTEKEKLEFLNKDNIGFQNKFSAALDLASNRTALNDTQQSDIDKKIVSLASGVNPEQLNDRQREIVARSAEKEAQRREAYETKAQKLREAQAGYQKNISEYIDTLRAEAAKGGTKALESFNVVFKDETENGVEVKKQANTAKQADVDNYYKNGGSTYLNDFQR